MGLGEVGEKLRRATVHIRRTQGRDGSGSGVILQSSGLIATNAHVIDGADSLAVELWDGQDFAAQVLTVDAPGDLATLHIPAAGLTALQLRTTPAQPGETVIAVGNPLGFSGALTRGAVRSFGPVPRFGKREFLHAEVQLAPGNSGGPLADSNGDVVGINTMMLSSGIALAIPASAVDDFVRYGPAPKLGVTFREVDLQSGKALLLLQVAPNSLAERASLLIGDIVTHLDGTRVDSVGDLSQLLSTSSAVRLRVIRGDQPEPLDVRIALPMRAAAGFAA